jgi:FtsH-binding integral membrane protein
MTPTESTVAPVQPSRFEFTACGPTAKLSPQAVRDVTLLYLGTVAIPLLVKLWTRAQTRPGLEPWTGSLLLAGALVAAGVIALLFWRLARRGDYWALFLGGGVAFLSIFRFDKTPLAAGTVLEKPLVLLPLVPAALTIWAFVKMVRSTDELQRRILYQALSVGFVVTFAATLAYSVLEDLGLPHVSAVWWWGTLVLSWIAGLAITSRRYR